MPIKFIHKNNQAQSSFAGGKLEENKPIAISTNRKSVRPFSNIFYWANTWTDIGANLPDHPHQGFEIFNYIINGKWHHFDKQNKKWIDLHAGDVQILHCGSGCKHSEKFDKDTQVIQIWFDPNLKKSLGHDAYYKSYASDDFYQSEFPGKTIKHLVGEDTPIEMISEDVRIDDYKVNHGEKIIKLDPEKFTSIYLIKGELEVGKTNCREDDFFIMKGLNEINLFSIGQSRFLLVETPGKLDYKTYLELKLKQN